MKEALPDDFGPCHGVLLWVCLGHELFSDEDRGDPLFSEMSLVDRWCIAFHFFLTCIEFPGLVRRFYMLLFLSQSHFSIGHLPQDLRAGLIASIIVSAVTNK